MASRASLAAVLLLAALLALCAAPRCAALKTAKRANCPLACKERYADHPKGSKPSFQVTGSTSASGATLDQCVKTCKGKKSTYYFFTAGADGKGKTCNCYTKCSKGLAINIASTSKVLVGGIAGSIAKC